MTIIREGISADSIYRKPEIRTIILESERSLLYASGSQGVYIDYDEDVDNETK